MRGKVAKLIRKVSNGKNTKKLKRAWHNIPWTERSLTRRIFEGKVLAEKVDAIRNRLKT